MTDAGFQSTNTEGLASETSSLGSVCGSRKGSASRVRTADGTSSGDNHPDGGTVTLRSSKVRVAPLSGTECSAESYLGEDTGQRDIDNRPSFDEAGGKRSSGAGIEELTAPERLEIIRWLKDRLVLPGFEPSRNWREHHDRVSREGGLKSCLHH